jgi:chromate transport protein ChrA
MVFSFLTFSQNIEAVSAIILLLISFLALETVFRNMWIMLFGLAVMMLIIGKCFSLRSALFKRKGFRA